MFKKNKCPDLLTNIFNFIGVHDIATLSSQINI